MYFSSTDARTPVSLDLKIQIFFHSNVAFIYIQHIFVVGLFIKIHSFINDINKVHYQGVEREIPTTNHTIINLPACCVLRCDLVNNYLMTENAGQTSHPFHPQIIINIPGKHMPHIMKTWKDGDWFPYNRLYLRCHDIDHATRSGALQISNGALDNEHHFM